MADFTLSTTLATPYDDAVALVRAELAEAGFGVLTEIDIKETLRTKLDLDVPARVILGACRPQLAHRALEVDPRIATMLPCNVVVSAVDDTTSLVEVLDPAVMTSFSDAPALDEVAREARERLTGMLGTLTETEEGRR